MRLRKNHLAALAVGLATAGLIACSNSSSSRSFGSAVAPSTSGTPGSPPGPTAPTVGALRVVGAPLVSGDVPLALKLVDASGAPATIAVSFSDDGGLTWSTASEAAAGSSGRAGLATGGGQGIEHIFVWDSLADMPRAELDVRLRVEIAQGGGADSAPFAVDNQVITPPVAFNRRPWLQSMTQTSVIVLWRTDAATDSVIELGDTPTLGTTLGDPQASTDDHVVRVDNLQPATRYYYRVSMNGQQATRLMSFETAPGPAGSPEFTFIAFGDSGRDSPEQNALALQMEQEDPDFVLHLGDIIYPSGGQGNVVPEYNRRFFKQYANILDERCVFPAPGNHDRSSFFGPYRETFMTPTNGLPFVGELYYSFEWGDAKFIMLESTYLFRFPLGPQMTWLMNELQSNQRKWLIVFLHHNLYSAGSHGDDTTLIGGLAPIFENNGVDLVMSGHEHNYERTKAIKQFNSDPAYNGLTYLVSGGGGTPLRPVTPNGNSAVAVSAHHYLKLTIRGDTLIGEAIDTNGTRIDSFAILNQ